MELTIIIATYLATGIAYGLYVVPAAVPEPTPDKVAPGTFVALMGLFWPIVAVIITIAGLIDVTDRLARRRYATPEAKAEKAARKRTLVPDGKAASLQARVAPWMEVCFGPEISADRVERNQRFLEEAMELAQANGASPAEAHALVDYVFGRPKGDLPQEVGGVMITLAALCLASGVDMHKCGDAELLRIWTKVDEIRAKQAAKQRYPSNPLTGLALVPDKAAGHGAQ